MTPPWVGGGGGNIGFGGRDGGRLYILESYLAYTYVSGRLSGSKPKKYIDSPQNRASNSLQFSRTVRPSEHCGPDRIGPDRISGRRRVLQKVPAAAVGSFSRECMDVADGPGTLAERGPGGGIEIISPSVTATNYSTLV